MKIKKLDGRMNGHGEFTRCVDFTREENQKFVKVRNWCWEQWGPSCELDFWYHQLDRNPAWCWMVDNWRIRLYFATEKEAQWFYLRWK